MTTDEEFRTTVDALGESVLVVGGGKTGRSVAADISESDVPATDSSNAPDAVVLAVDATESIDDGLIEAIPDAVVRIASVTISDRPAGDERETLEAIAARVGTVVLASGNSAEDLTSAVAAIVSIVRDPGIVNVDLADVETVFRAVELAALGVGSSSIEEPIAAVKNAFDSLPRSIETDAASGALINLVGPPETTVEDVNEVISAVRSRVGPDAHVIWGGIVDAPERGELEVSLVLAGVESARVTPGDDCPRCGTALSAYTLGERTMVSCEACGYAGVPVRLRRSYEDRKPFR